MPVMRLLMILLLLVLVVVNASSMIAATLSCSSTADCSFGGACTTSGVCVCDAGFAGVTCALLDNSTRIPVISGFRLDDYHVWGSQVVFERSTNLYRMAASIYPITLSFYQSWLFSAQIVIASAASPLGPFALDSIVLPYAAESHWDRSVMNPKLLRAPGENSRWLLFYVGSTYVGLTPNATVPIPTGQAQSAQASQRIGVASAPSPLGPFTRLPQPILEPRPGQWDDRMVSNPAIVAFGYGQNTSLLMVYKASSPSDANETQTRVCFGVASASAWNMPFLRLRNDPILPCPDNSFYAEDPTLWRGIDGIFHLVFKDFDGHYTHDGYSGAHATSIDGVNWDVTSPALAYTTTHTWSDGKVRTQKSQERAQILLNETIDGGDGLPLVAYFATSTELNGSQRFWNMAMPLRR